MKHVLGVRTEHFLKHITQTHQDAKCPDVSRAPPHLSLVVLVGAAAVELQLGVGVITLVVLAHPGDEGVVLGVLDPQRPREKEVHEAAVLEGEAEVVEVAQQKGVGLDRRGLDDAVEHDPVAVVLQDPGGDELGAVVVAVALTDLRRTR